MGRVVCRLLCVVLVGMVALFVQEGMGNVGEKTGETVNMLFLIENMTDAGIKLRALADWSELFVEELEGPESLPPAEEGAPQEVPPPPPFPTLELKVPLPLTARQLEVEEMLHLGTRARRAVFDIGGFARGEGGFRITVRQDGILLQQDYVPIQ